MMSENACKPQTDLLFHCNCEYFWSIDPIMPLFKLLKQAYPMQMLITQLQKIESKFYVFAACTYSIAKHSQSLVFVEFLR